MWTMILWFLIIGIAFYFLMRMGGCGAHGHGGHGGHGSDEDHGAAWTVKDPVCGAEGPADQAPATADYNGKPYYFCSQKCRDLFLENPQQHVDHDPPTTQGEHHHVH